MRIICLLLLGALVASLPVGAAEAKEKGKVTKMKDGTLGCVDSSGTMVEGPTGRWRTKYPATVGADCEAALKVVRGDVLNVNISSWDRRSSPGR